MDDADNAQNDIEIQLRMSLANRSTKPEAEATGYCLACGELLAKGLRWCDAECRDDWESTQPKAPR